MSTPRFWPWKRLLPGANCGGCGHAGVQRQCRSHRGRQAAPNSCVAAGPRPPKPLPAILGVSVEAKEPDIAAAGMHLRCGRCRHQISLRRSERLPGRGPAQRRHEGLHHRLPGAGHLRPGLPLQRHHHGARRPAGGGRAQMHRLRHLRAGLPQDTSSPSLRSPAGSSRNTPTDDCTTPCQRACPAGINISGYIAAGRPKGITRARCRSSRNATPSPRSSAASARVPVKTTADANMWTNPWPSISSNALRPITNGQSGERIQPFKAPDTGRRIAVVGGGVEGLSTAFFSARLGHAATVYRSHRPDGRSAAHRHRPLPPAPGYPGLGYRRHPGDGRRSPANQAMGRDVTIAGLLEEGYEAVFLARGMGQPPGAQ